MMYNELQAAEARKKLAGCIAKGADGKATLRIMDVGENGLTAFGLHELSAAANFGSIEEFFAQFVGEDGSGNPVLRVSIDLTVAS